MDDINDTKTKLMTLLNVSHLKSVKRKLGHSPSPLADDIVSDEPAEKRVKLNKKRASVAMETSPPAEPSLMEGDDLEVPEESRPEEDELHEDEFPADDDKEDIVDSDPFILHFGPESKLLSAEARKSVDAALWKKATTKLGKTKFSRTVVTHTIVSEDNNVNGSTDMTKVLLPRLATQFTKNQAKLGQGLKDFTSSVMENIMSSSCDLLLSNVQLHEHAAVRQTISLYLLNHILKIRRIVLKNNDRVSAASSKSLAPPEDIQDQGFTRPSTLILVPFRNSALSFLESFLNHSTSSISQTTTKTQEAQVHHYARFISQYSLPEGTVDKLATADPGTYPEDHVHTFSGNIDDNFRIGVKVTKRSIRLFEGFYGADLIVASPLGLRLACEKEGNADFLSSIEVVVVDQVDAMLMQNWDHVQYIFSHLNKIPKDSHDADFSRIKPWYLDGYASYLRQTIMLSHYETPEVRALFNSLKNVAGKTRTTTTWEASKVPEGLDQKFIKFESSNARDEADRRFDYFRSKLFPSILKSAVQSSGTIIFVPSYFDFVRVQNWLMKNGKSCAFISEYSSNEDISRARQAFFSGAKSFMVITERFHFFRRYRLRGVRNIIFYALPDHAQFYSELLSFPFLDDNVEASDVTIKVLYSKYDMMRLERIVGTKAVGALIRD